MDQQSLAVTVGKSVTVYLAMLFVVRILGKRAVGNFSPFDLLVALMIGDMVGDTIFNSIPLGAGLAGIATIAALEYGNSWLSYLGFNHLLEGTPSIVVRDGACREPGMRKERMNRGDIMGVLREHGVTDIRQIKLAVVEADGHISVIEHEWSQPVEKADLLPEETRRRADSLSGPDGEDASTISGKNLPGG